MKSTFTTINKWFAGRALDKNKNELAISKRLL